MSEPSLWTNRAFRLLFAARVVDQAGNAIAPIALAFAVLDLTGSTADVGLALAGQALAFVTLVLAGGVVADRMSRRLVLVWSNVVALAAEAALAGLVLAGTATMPLVVVLSMVIGGMGAASRPASTSVLPMVVAPGRLQQANALHSSAMGVARMAGLVGGASVVAFVGPGWALALNAASFGVAGLLYGFLRLPPGAPRARRSTFVADLVEGWGAFTARPWTWITTVSFTVMNAAFAGAIGVLGPAIADDTIGRARWGWVTGAEMAGLLAIVLVLARTAHRTRLWLGMVGTALTAPWLLALGWWPHTGLLVVAAAISGIGMGYWDVAWETSLQSHVPARQLARVSSWFQLGALVAVPIGQVTTGPIAELAGATATATGLAVVLLVGALLPLASRSLRRLPAAGDPREAATIA